MHISFSIFTFFKIDRDNWKYLLRICSIKLFISFMFGFIKMFDMRYTLLLVIECYAIYYAGRIVKTIQLLEMFNKNKDMI